MIKDFCVFILTHGRPDRVITYKTLKKSGYTGPIFLIVDDEDKTRSQYIEKYGDKVITFSKSEVAKLIDEGDNFDDRRTILYARNACFDIARQLGYRYFIQLDDDYTIFEYRYRFDQTYITWVSRELDKVFEALLDYYKSIPALTLVMGQGGDYIGGSDSSGFGESIRTKRKAMNTFICDTERQFQFMGRMNEDVNTYTLLGRRGELLLMVGNVNVVQGTSQKNDGGITELYKKFGTYVKSFYSVMYCPSSVKVTDMGDGNKRIHHRVDWETTAVKIIAEKYRK